MITSKSASIRIVRIARLGPFWACGCLYVLPQYCPCAIPGYVPNIASRVCTPCAQQEAARWQRKTLRLRYQTQRTASLIPTALQTEQNRRRTQVCRSARLIARCSSWRAGAGDAAAAAAAAARAERGRGHGTRSGVRGGRKLRLRRVAHSPPETLRCPPTLSPPRLGAAGHDAVVLARQHACGSRCFVGRASVPAEQVREARG
eukprot:3430733-Rhodomonas_salina.1